MTEVSDNAPDRAAREADSEDPEVREDRGDQEDHGDLVELAVPARSAYVSVLRSTASALAARLDFTLDEIDDLRIAVDEASALLLAQALPGSQLHCRLRLAGNELTVSVTADAHEPRLPAQESFAWTVLTALAGPVDAVVDPARRKTTLTLTKRAEAVRESSTQLGGAVHDLESARSARGEALASADEQVTRGQRTSTGRAGFDPDAADG